METEKQFSRLQVMFFMAWFILSVAGMVVCAGINSLYALEIFGQYFFILGIILLIIGKDLKLSKQIATAFTLCGLVVMLLSTSTLIRINYPKEVVMIDIMTFLALIVFLLIGVSFCFVPLARHKKRLKECNIEVLGKVDKLKEKFLGKSISYLPIYKYFYKGHYHTYDDGIYKSYLIPKQNSYKKLHINPDDLSDVYRCNYLLNIVMLFVGISFILFAMFGMTFTLYY